MLKGGNSSQTFQIQYFREGEDWGRWSPRLTITEFHGVHPNRELGRILGIGEGGGGGTSKMVLGLLGGQWESETTTKPRCILELPEEKGRTRRWGGVYTLTTGWTSSGLVWLFLASFQLFPEDEWAKQGFRR